MREVESQDSLLIYWLLLTMQHITLCLSTVGPHAHDLTGSQHDPQSKCLEGAALPATRFSQHPLAARASSNPDMVLGSRCKEVFSQLHA